MVRLPELLTDVSLEGADEPYSIGVSWGFKDFSDSAELEEAIKIADREMYRRKHERKSRTYNLPELPRRPELTAL
jgi:PleD family two-component response regulator